MQFGEQRHTIYEALGTNKRNCKVQNIRKLKNYNYNQYAQFDPKNCDFEPNGLCSDEECTHVETAPDFRRTEYWGYYEQIMKFMRKYKETYAEFLSKEKVIQILKDRYFDFENMSEEEQKLFKNPHTSVELFKHPLMYMVKKLVREQVQDGLQTQ